MILAAKILIVGGVLHYAYSFITGVFMGIVRQTEPAVPKYLSLTHVGAFMNGSMLLAMTIAIQLSPLSDNTEVLAAALLVSGAFLLALKDTINWLLKVDDEFREVNRPYGQVIGGLSALASTVGLIIVIVGVFQGL